MTTKKISFSHPANLYPQQIVFEEDNDPKIEYVELEVVAVYEDLSIREMEVFLSGVNIYSSLSEDQIQSLADRALALAQEM